MKEEPENWTLTMLKASWVPFGLLLGLVSIVLVFGWPDRMPLWTPALLPLLGLDTAMGGIAMGGPAIKRAQETIANVEGK